MTASKIVAAAASSAGGGPTDVDDVFSTFVYDGNGSARSINNGIDLAGKGGLVWFKQHNSARDFGLFNTERGAGKYLVSNDTNVEATSSTMLSAFNSDGFSIAGGGGIVNNGVGEYVSWTFRKAEKFFDIVEWTGDGTSNRTLSHNLGSTPGMIIAKSRSTTNEWMVWHRDLANNENLRLNTNDGQGGYGSFYESGMSSTTFGVNSTSANYGNNISGQTYIAFLFAHNNNDGEFGPNEDQDIIKCGNFSKGYSGIVTVDLGFEPQFIMVKKYSGSAGAWYVGDQMRGMCSEMLPNYEARTSTLRWDVSNDQANGTDIFEPTATGFIVRNDHQYIDGGEDYVYMAIRRGPLATPTAATDVFIPGTGTTDKTTFPVDSLWSAYRDGYSYNFTFYDRLRSIDRGRQLVTNQALQEGQNNTYSLSFTSNTGVVRSWGSLWIHYMLRRAPGFYDVVCYDGNGTAKTVSHNLGVVPEMMWVKQRSGTNGWRVYHSALGNTKVMYLDATTSAQNGSEWNNTSPTSSNFTVGSAGSINGNNHGYVAYLFATLAGVSKVGSYTGNGSSQNIDCGFSSGARFVLIKRSSNGGDWYVFDGLRGIVAGSDPYLRLNTNAAESQSDDLDPLSSGFTVNQSSASVNFDTHTYIFYAIA